MAATQTEDLRILELIHMHSQTYPFAVIVSDTPAEVDDILTDAVSYVTTHTCKGTVVQFQHLEQLSMATQLNFAKY